MHACNHQHLANLGYIVRFCLQRRERERERKRERERERERRKEGRERRRKGGREEGRLTRDKRSLEPSQEAVPW
jgi:hypothetical protein